MFGWLKNYLPRGIYGRAALIVAVPFLALQVIVSASFIQRHFEDVTRQMVRTTTVMLTHVFDELAEDGLSVAQSDVAVPLGIALERAAVVPSENARVWYDVSGRSVIANLETVFDVAAIDLSNRRVVTAYIRQGGEVYQVAFPRRYVSARNPHQLLVLMVVAGLVMIVIAFIYLRNQLRPIKRLAAASEAFGRGRNEPYHPSGASEVRAAGSAFLDMRGRILRQIEQRTLMLSGVSHDLRTPLTRMRLALSMMEEPEAEALRADVEDMNRMIDAFLDFARVGAEEDAVATDLAALLHDSVENARRAGHQLEAEEPFAPMTMPLRALGLRRSVDNLISNAARYGTRVRLALDVFERSVRIRVEDNGPGIPENQREDAMRPFLRLDPARGQNQGGSVGLGLAIAADTARRHGGTLRL
ncbi:MAG: ATP-binding protein, partial [Pseudomonadota bacterium]